MIRTGICPLLTEEVVRKLKASGIRTVIDFISGNCEEISRKSTIPYKDVLAIQRVLFAQYGAFPQSADQLYEDVVNSAAILSTGCPSIDQLLDDGLYTSEVTEIVGSAGSGKTQFCLNCCLSVSINTSQNAFFIDTGGGFDAERLMEMIAARNKDESESESILKRIRCQHVFSIFDLLTELEKLKTTLNQRVEPFFNDLKLVIVDCVASVVSPVLGGQQTDGHGYMMHLAHSLKSLAVDYSLVVLVTNNLVHSADVPRAALGRSWASVPNARLFIGRPGDDAQGAKGVGGEKRSVEGVKKSSAGARVLTLVKSTRQAVGSSVAFSITERGVE